MKVILSGLRLTTILASSCLPVFAHFTCPDDQTRAPIGTMARPNNLASEGQIPVLYESQEIFQSVNEATVEFGTEIAVDSETMVIAKRAPYLQGYDSVEVYELRDGDWSFVKQLRPPGQGISDYFARVALDGDTLVVGSPWHCNQNDTCQSGAVFIFERNVGGADNWGFVKRVDGGNKTGAWFGNQTALQGDTLVVTATHERVGATETVGAAYVFERDHGAPDAWGLVKRLESDPALQREGDFFGSSVWLADDTITVEGDDSSAVYVFDRNEGGQDNWGLSQKITIPENQFDPHVFDGQTIVIRARNQCIPIEETTNHLVFYERSAEGVWEVQQDLDTGLDVKYLTLDGNQLIAKSRNAAVAYLFERGSTPDSWQVSAQLQNSQGHEPLTYSPGLTLEAGRALVGEVFANGGEGVVLSYDIARPMNFGHSGAYFYPSTSGQGQFLEVDPVSQFVFLGWFTYTQADSAIPNEQHWYTAEGLFNGSQAELVLYESLGGVFDAAQPVDTTPVGTATLSFADCNQGTMSYVFDDGGPSGSFPLVRVIPGSGNVCEAAGEAAVQTVDVNHGMDGAWYDPNTSGQGFFFDVHDTPEGNSFLFISWFTYGDGTTSGQRWLTAEGDFEGSSADLVIYDTNGGSFDDPTPVNSEVIGTMHIEFSDCGHAVLNYSMPGEGTEGSINIERVIPGTEGSCEQLLGLPVSSLQ